MKFWIKLTLIAGLYLSHDILNAWDFFTLAGLTGALLMGVALINHNGIGGDNEI